jgi:hypothetical protein
LLKFANDVKQLQLSQALHGISRQDPFLYFSVWAFLVAMSVVVSISFLTRPEPAEKQAYVITGPRKKGTR